MSKSPYRPPLGDPILLTRPHMAIPAWAAWQAHVDAGRIGGAAARMRRASNEPES